MSEKHDPRDDRPESTDAELEELRSRVRYIGDGIILYKEVPTYSTFTFGVLFERAAELGSEHHATVIICDLGEVERRPGAATREAIMAGLRRQPYLEHLVVITGQRLLFNVALKFIVSTITRIKTSAFSTLDEALKALRDEQDQR